MRKGKISLVLCTVFMIALLSGCGSTSSSNTIKIGAVGPLTGSIASFGKSGESAIKLLVKQTNANGGLLGKQIELVSVDDQGKPDIALNVGQKLIDQDKVVGIIGPLTTGSSKALGPIATKNSIPMVTGTATEDTVTTVGGAYVFRTCFTDTFQGNQVSKFAINDLKAKTVAILYNNASDYSTGLAKVYKANFEKLGGKVVYMETYNSGEQDFNAQITNMKSKNPDVIFLPDYYDTVGLIAKQARAQGITVPMLGVDGWDSPDLFKIAGNSVEGCYFLNHYSPDDTSAEVVAFVSAYKAEYGTVPDALAALSYDAGKVLFEAIKKAGKTDGPSIMAALKQTNITVVSGKITFDEKRDAVKPAVILKIENGKAILYKKIEAQQ